MSHGADIPGASDRLTVTTTAAACVTVWAVCDANKREYVRLVAELRTTGSRLPTAVVGADAVRARAGAIAQQVGWRLIGRRQSCDDDGAPMRSCARSPTASLPFWCANRVSSAADRPTDRPTDAQPASYVMIFNAHQVRRVKRSACVCVCAFLMLATGRAIQPRARRQASLRPVRCRSRRRRVRSLTDCVRILQATLN